MNFWATYKKDFRLNLKLAAPIMAGQAGQITVNVVDNLMVGHLGAASLSAISMATAIFIVFLVVGMGISYGLPPLISKADGAGDYDQIPAFFKHSLVINIIIAFLIIAGIESLIPLMDHLGQDPEALILAKPYLRISAWSMLPIMLFQTFRCYSDGMSETLPPMIAMLIGNAANIFLNYVLIFGKFGVEPLGVRGAALGTLISRVIMLVLLTAILFYWKDLWSYIRKAQFFTYQKSIFNKIFSLSIPTSMQMFFECSGFAGSSLLMGMIHKEAQAAHQIAINLAAISFLICSGLGMASTIRVGNQLGQKNFDGVRKAGISAIIQVVLFMFCVGIIFIITRHFLPTMYIDDGKVISIAAGLLVLAAIFQIPDGVQVVAIGALRGVQDVKMPTFITFVAYWVFGLPISYVAAFHFDLGPAGVWWGLVFGLSISAGLLTLRFWRLTRL